MVDTFSKPLSCGLVQLDNFEHTQTKESLSPREGEEPVSMSTKGKHRSLPLTSPDVCL